MVADILVVDDALVERLLIEGLLRKNPDYRVALAEHGKDALAQIEKNPPDLVVSDLIMPEMDGVALVRTIRKRFPTIPVVLMTAYGDESTAVQAFEAGAASYVPKSCKAGRLLETVERVVEHAVADRNRERLARQVLEYHCRFALDNDRQLIRVLVDHVQQTMAGMGVADTVERIRMGEALEQALLNAMYHGNLEISREELLRVRDELDDSLLDRLVEERLRVAPICDRKILVVIHLTTSGARFVIRDEGNGFNQVLAVAGETSERFESGYHRGLTLMHSLMDNLSFNDAGNELTLRKAFH